MGHTFKLNHRAFNRGVDEVITLRPMRRAISKVMSESFRNQMASEADIEGRRSSRGAAIVVREKPTKR